VGASATDPGNHENIPRDTSPDSFRRYVEILRAMPPHRRLAQAVALTKAVRELAAAGIRQRHPRASSDEIRARLAARLYGREVAERLYGTLPDDAS
jgi:hypothetical protein